MDRGSQALDHLLVREIEGALGWPDGTPLGREFATGRFADQSLVERIVTPSKILDIVTRRFVEPPRLRLFQDSRELHPSEYLRVQENRRRPSVRTLDPTSVTALLDAGVTLVLDGLETFDPIVEVATRALRWWSGELVQTNAYLTTRSADGFPLHWDDHDVLIVQLAGEKNWDVRGSTRSAPMFRDAVPNEVASSESVWQGVLRAGEVLHIPRGYWHQATRVEHDDPVSLHLTFGFTRRTGVDWLTWIADQAREQELFRTDLTRSSADREAERVRLQEAAIELVRSLPPEVFLTARERTRPPARHAPTLPSAHEPEVVVCVTEFAPHVERSEGQLVVFAGGRKITVRDRAAAAIELLLSGCPVDLAAAEARVGFDVRPLARVFVREGICVGLTPELAAGYAGLVTGGTPWKLG
ncbi:cupin [Frankia sp. AgB1.9]|nr:cupin [Frankia sp. AgW1.1]MBL7547129.1 cupin [Frankia sp. AgB1.9]MBL7620067.1 cupin [Frankia sp. AgB1.8]